VSEESDDNLVAKCPECLKVVFVVENSPAVMDAEMLKEIEKLIKVGFLIGHMTTKAMRDCEWGCKCD
jgi:hypothetical protein